MGYTLLENWKITPRHNAYRTISDVKIKRAMDIQSFVQEAKQHHVLVITTVVLTAITTIILMTLLKGGKKEKKPIKVNYTIKQDNPKVVDTVKCPEIENLPQCKDGKVVMCRCWKSSTFPYCDGSHNNHNKETGDNVGPLIIQAK